MASYREQKRKGRLQLHQRLSESALYLSHPSAQPQAVTVRLHVSFDQLGELFNRIGFAQRNEAIPRIIFLTDQVDPVRNAIVVSRDLGAYMIDNTLPPDDITQATEVTRMSDSQVTALGWDAGADWLGLPPPEL